jgi:hypothetical protein
VKQEYAKQDRVRPRTPEDLERKYNFEKKFAEIKEEIRALHDKLDEILLAIAKSNE